MGLLDAVKRLWGGGTAAEEEDPANAVREAAAAARAARGRRSISQQVASIRGKAGVGEFRPSWEHEHDDPTVSTDGPLAIANVTCSGDTTPLEISFAVAGNHLVATVGPDKVYRIALNGLQAIKLRGNNLTLDVHMPLPLHVRGKLRAIRSLSGTVDDEIAIGRWKWLSSRHHRSFAECPYCFKTALDVSPSDAGAEQPLKDGQPYATAHCRSCQRNFHYDYISGEFSGADSPDARI